jgi:ABC-type transporter Mla subunit MlaD
MADSSIIFKPNLNVSSLVMALIIIGVIIFFVLHYAYVQSNWESQKFTEGRFYVAPLYGKSTEETIKELTEEESKNTINNKLQSIRTQLADLSNSLVEAETTTNEVGKDISTANTSIMGSLNTLSGNAAGELSKMKEALKKTLASVFISTKINDETLDSVQKLQDEGISKIVNKYNSAVSSVNKKPLPSI